MLKGNEVYAARNIIHNTIVLAKSRDAWRGIKPVYSNPKAPERECNRLNGACNESVYYFSPGF